MSNLSDFDAPKKPWLTGLIPVLVILLEQVRIGFSIPIRATSETYRKMVAMQNWNTLRVGKNYYSRFWNRTLSNKWRFEKLGSWNGGPDICYSIKWLGNEIFESSVKDDTCLQIGRASNWLEVEWSIGENHFSKWSDSGAKSSLSERWKRHGNCFDNDLAKDDSAGRSPLLYQPLWMGKNKRDFKKVKTVSVAWF